MMARIEDYYLPADGNDWLPAIIRAQRDFHTPGDPTGTPGFGLEFGPGTSCFSDSIRVVRSMRLAGAAGKVCSTAFRFAPDKGGILCALRPVSTILARTVTRTQTTFTLAPITGIGAGAELVVEGEQVTVTCVSGNEFTVLRGAGGTAAAAHSRGARVDLIGHVEASVIERIQLLGGGGTSLTAHGVTMHARAALRDLAIVGFPGDGIHIEATPPTENAINWEVTNVQVNSCGGDGLSVDGA